MDRRKCCGKCYYKCVSTKTLSQHELAAHVEGGLPCARCPCAFATERARLAHMIRTHQERYNKTIGLSTLQPCNLLSVVPRDPRVSRRDFSFKRRQPKYTDTTSKIHNNKQRTKRSTSNIAPEENDNLEPPSLEEKFDNFDRISPTIPNHVFDDDSDEQVSDQPHKFQFPIEDKGTNSEIVWYKCKLCGFKSLRKPSLALHILKQHDKDDISCTTCSLKCSSILGLEQHYRNVHRKPSVSVPAGKTNGSTRPQTTIIEMSLDDLQELGCVPHKTSDLRDFENCYIQEPVQPVEPAIKMQPPPSESQAERPVRRRTFTQVKSHKINRSAGIKRLVKFRREARALTKNKPKRKFGGSHTCSKCGIVVTSLQSLYRHLEKSHIEGGQFPCNLCTCVFDVPPGLRGHKTLYHPSNPHKRRKSSPTRKSLNDDIPMNSYPVSGIEAVSNDVEGDDEDGKVKERIGDDATTIKHQDKDRFVEEFVMVEILP